MFYQIDNINKEIEIIFKNINRNPGVEKYNNQSEKFIRGTRQRFHQIEERIFKFGYRSVLLHFIALCRFFFKSNVYGDHMLE